MPKFKQKTEHKYFIQEVEKCDIKAVKYWLSKIKDIKDIKDDDGDKYYPLNRAIDFCDYKLFKILVDNGADVFEFDGEWGFDKSLLSCLCHSDDSKSSEEQKELIKMAKLLLKKGVKFTHTYIKGEDFYMNEPLIAAFYGNDELSVFLQLEYIKQIKKDK